MKKVYEYKINGVVRERMTVNRNSPKGIGIAFLEMFAFDGKPMHREWLVATASGEIHRYKPRYSQHDSMVIRAVERGNREDY